MVLATARAKNFFRISLVFFLVICSTIIYSQNSIRVDHRAADPVPKNSSLGYEERLEIHKDFLAKAEADGNRQYEFFGQLYVFYDYLKLHDYVASAACLLAAKKIAEEAQNNAWLGWASYWQGLLKNYLKNEEEGLVHYQDAARFCAAAGDSLCYAESLEQVASKFMYFDSFTLAEQYFQEAIPLLRKFGEKRQLGTAYGNFGSLYLLTREPDKAIPYLEQALLINQELGNHKSEGKNRNNLASAYRRQGKAKRAIEEYKKCIAFNQEHDFPNNLINNYLGLYFAYMDLEDYKSALESVSRHEELKDSLISLETQKQIALLETEYEVAQTELALKRSEAELTAAKLSKTRAFTVVIVAMFIIGIIVWRWQAQLRQARKEALENLEDLMQLTRVLTDKSRIIYSLKSTVKRLEVESKGLAGAVAVVTADEEEEESLYTSTILTDDDWNTFRARFEKSFPNYIFRLRSAFPDLTPAEERLFLLLKLNLGRKEIADMLGLSVGSIKKTRSRLRKRLSLDSEESLEDFIRDF
jgi:tetratricopeptide (TPR) repeat protein